MRICCRWGCSGFRLWLYWWLIDHKWFQRNCRMDGTEARTQKVCLISGLRLCLRLVDFIIHKAQCYWCNKTSLSLCGRDASTRTRPSLWATLWCCQLWQRVTPIIFNIMIQFHNFNFKFLRIYMCVCVCVCLGDNHTARSEERRVG